MIAFATLLACYNHIPQVSPASDQFSWFYGSQRSPPHTPFTKTPPAAQSISNNNPGVSSIASRSSRSHWGCLYPPPCRHNSVLESPTPHSHSLPQQAAALQGHSSEQGTNNLSQHPPQPDHPHRTRHQKGSKAARLVHAGELTPVCVDVWSSLPSPLTLDNLCLVLRTLVRNTPPAYPPHSHSSASTSILSVSSSTKLNYSAGGEGRAFGAVSQSSVPPMSPPRHRVSYDSAASRASVADSFVNANPQQMGAQPHSSPQQAMKLDAAQATDSKGVGAGNGWVEGPDLRCTTLLEVVHLGSASADEPSVSSCGSTVDRSVRQPLSHAVLQPGWNR